MKKDCPWNHVRLLKDYLHGDPSSKLRPVIEAHLRTCSDCTDTLNRLKQGDRFARMISETSSAPDIWERIEPLLNESKTGASRWPGPRAILAASVTILALAAAILIWSVQRLDSHEFSPGDRKYKMVSLAGIAENTEPHIVTEGVVSEVSIDGEDGDYKIKLKENLQKPGPFVVCEILRPSNIPVPAVGKRVRVYGVSRYDDKPGHQWYEVHPVFGIQMIQ